MANLIGADRLSVCVAIAVVLFVGSAQAQTHVVYDDALQNGWQDYSYGAGSTFGSVEQAHAGASSMKFVGNNYNALSVAHTSSDVSMASVPVLHFWVHGGATGGQQLRVNVYHFNALGAPFANAELDPYIAGGTLVAGQWREVTIDLTQAPFSAAGVGRIDIQSDQAAAQGALYVDDLTFTNPAPQAASLLAIDHNVSVAGMTSDRFTWQDSTNRPRVAALAHNDGQVGPDAGRGGSLREFRYQLSNGAQRVAGLTGYGAGDGGFGYVVMHTSRSGCIGDDSPLGGFEPGNGFERIFEGRHHAIFRFHQNYPRNCAAMGTVIARTVPVTIDWVFSTGRDNPVWAITIDIDQAAAVAGGAIAPVNTFYDDSRAPYGELAIDGNGSAAISGVAWGDRYKFTTLGAAATMNSAWDWTQANTVPYVKEWLNGPLGANNTLDATMGIVQTQTIDQQDAGGGRDPDVGSDMRDLWAKTSATVGNACTNLNRVHPMPCANDWPYQANANSLDYAFDHAGAGLNNARLTWKTQLGFMGQQTYATNNGGPATTAPGFPKKSYSTYIVLGTHSSGPVEAQVEQVEAMQAVSLSTIIGAVRTSGPAGNTRVDNVTYSPAGYDHVYGALAFNAAGNQVDGNIAVGAGRTLKKPLVIVGNYTGGDPTLRLNGVALTADADFFASLRPAASQLWVTLNRDFSGATNRVEILAPAAPGAPGVPTGVIAAAVTATRVDVSWTAVAGADSYQIDRRAAGGAFGQIGTSNTPSYPDNSALSNSAYLYRVRAVNGGGTSASSPADLATTVIFTDDPLNAGVSVKAVHLSELRTAVDAVRFLAGLLAGSYTDAANPGTLIKAVHITEIRTALDAARLQLTLSTGGYTDAALAGVAIRAVHVQELRGRLQ